MSFRKDNRWRVFFVAGLLPENGNGVETSMKKLIYTHFDTVAINN